MASGPALVYKQFKAADYQAVKLSSAKAEQGIVTCSSLVLLRHSDDSTCGQAPLLTAFVGRVSAWLSHMPPWVMPDTQAEEFEAACEKIADVSWHKCKGLNTDMYKFPVISKQFEDDLDGSSGSVKHLRL